MTTTQRESTGLSGWCSPVFGAESCSPAQHAICETRLADGRLDHCSCAKHGEITVSPRQEATEPEPAKPDPQLDHHMVALEGPGFACTDYDDQILPGRWATEDDALLYGIAGKYLLSGNAIVRAES